MSYDKAFEVEHGFLIENGPFVTGGAASPIGLNYPTDTLYLQNTVNGVLLWMKFSTGVNDWRRISAKDIPFDPSTSSLVSTTTQTVIEELNTLLNSGAVASPGYHFSRGGLVQAGTYLYAGQNVSNKTGLPILMNNPVVQFIRCESTFTSTYEVSLYTHFGNTVGGILVGVVNVTPTVRSFSVNWTNVNPAAQLACRITSGSVKGSSISCVIKGDS
jgi:hypothetical protein